MIEADHLSRRFGALLAVDSVSFEVKRGEAVGFLGPNGAGKTTTFRMLSGILHPSSGSARICGKDLSKEPLLARAKLGFMPENAPLYPELTPEEYLRFRAELKGLPSRKRRDLEVSRVLEQAHCADARKTLISHLSKGYRQRVALADVLLHRPPALLLDEPTAGLDPNQVGDVRRLIRELATDHAVLVSTHVLSEVEATCQRAIVLHRGHVVTEASLEELGRRGKAGHFLVARGPQPLRVLPAADLAAEWQPLDEDRIRITTPTAQELNRLIDLVREAGYVVEEAGRQRVPLDDVFEDLTREDA